MGADGSNEEEFGALSEAKRMIPVFLRPIKEQRLCLEL